MEAPRNPQSDDHPSPRTSSPTTPSSSSSCSNNGVLPFPPVPTTPTPAAPPPPTPPPLTPRTIPRSDANPYPTTFIQADTASFKQVVQMLTGSAETAAKHAAGLPAPRPLPPSRPPGPKKPAFKLYERRGSFRHLKMISPLLPSFLGSSAPASPAAAFSPRKAAEILSPSMLDLPSLSLSPVTPLIHDPFNRCSPRPPSSSSSSMSEEEMAIAEKGFYLHPSPRTTPRDAEPPRLLPLFPVTSPRMPSAAASPP